MALITFSGLASGIDSKALIDALISQQRKGRISPLEDKISKATDTNSALASLKSAISKLSTALDSFRTVSGGIVFRSATSSNASSVSASSSSYATDGTYNVTVNQLAQTGSASLSSSAGIFTSSTQNFSAINDGTTDAERTLSIKVGDGAEQTQYDFVLTSTTTLEDLATQINSQVSGAVASVVNAGSDSSPDYKLLISTSNQGLAQGKIEVQTGSELATKGYFDDNLINQATDAEFTIDGIGSGSGGSSTISRSSNTITDVIPGLTLTLKEASATPVTITVKPDTASSVSAMQGFVDAYNELYQLAKEKDAVTVEEVDGENQATFGALASSSLDESLLSLLRSSFSAASTSGGNYNTLADLGITTNRDGTLSFDGDTFTTAIEEDPESVTTITQNLGDALGGVDGTLAQFTNYSGLIDIATRANDLNITRVQERITATERILERQESSLTQQFARLESLVSQLQSSQNALSQILTSI